VQYSPPKRKDLYHHEARTARKARYIIGGLQVLSGVTALLGIRLYFADWIAGLPLWANLGITLGIGLLLVAPAEMGIREAWSYVFRSALHRFHRGLNLYSLLLMLGVAIALTAYSFFLSQYATRNSLKRVAPTVALKQTQGVTEQYQAEIDRLARDYQQQRGDIRQRYEELIAAERSYFDNLLAANSAEIKRYEEKGQRSGQVYTTRIQQLETSSLQLKTELAGNVKALKEQENQELADLEDWKKQAERAALQEKSSTRKRIEDRNDSLLREQQNFATIFSTLLARFAAWSVVLVILFTGFLEIFYFKTGVQRLYREDELRSSVVVDLLLYPYVYMSRHLAHFVRGRYRQLPDVQPSPGMEELFRKREEQDRRSEAEDRWEMVQEYAERHRYRQDRHRSTEGPSQDNVPKADLKEEEMSLGSIFRFAADEQKDEDMPKQNDGQRERKTTSRSKGTGSWTDPTLFGEGHEEELPTAQHQPPPRHSPSTEQENRVDLNSIRFGGHTTPEETYTAADSDVEEELSRPMIKHIDKHTGDIQHYDMDDLDAIIEELVYELEVAAESYQESGSPADMARFNELQEQLGYWQKRKVELSQKMRHYPGYEA